MYTKWSIVIPAIGLPIGQNVAGGNRSLKCTLMQHFYSSYRASHWSERCRWLPFLEDSRPDVVGRGRNVQIRFRTGLVSRSRKLAKNWTLHPGKADFLISMLKDVCFNSKN